MCANTHIITFRISADVVSGLTLQHNPVCQAEHAPVAPTTSHHQAFSKSTPFCNRASESCTGFPQLPQRTASKPRQLIISATCWQEMPNPYLTNNRTQSATSHLNLEGLQRQCQVEKMSIVPPERVLTLALQDADRAYPSRLNPGTRYWVPESRKLPDLCDKHSAVIWIWLFQGSNCERLRKTDSPFGRFRFKKTTGGAWCWFWSVALKICPLTLH